MFARFKDGVSLRLVGAAFCTAAILSLAGCGEVYVHEEFDKSTMNKTDAQVLDTIGKPTTVDANDPKRVTWTYYAKTVDVDNQNKRDIKAVLTLEPDAASHNLKVVKVEYQKS